MHIKKKDFDNYANIIHEWVAGGSSNGMEQVQAYYTISNQVTEYSSVNKSIPSCVSSQTSSEDEDMHYVSIRTENVLDSTNSYIVKQNNYIHDTRYDWDKFEDVETKTLVDTTEYVHDSQGRLIETNQSVVNKDNTDHKITEYTYDSKYGVYTETVTDIGAYYDPEGNAINSQKNIHTTY